MLPRPVRVAPLLIAGALSLAACSFFEQPSQTRGNPVDADMLKELVPGTSTRADATALLGSPTARATFDDNTWIYIGERTRPVIGATNAVLSQRVVVLTFNQQGVLQDVRRLSEEDSMPVAVVDRTTPSPGSNASILQQLLGNVGRFNAGGAGSNAEAPSGGAPAGTGGP